MIQNRQRGYSTAGLHLASLLSVLVFTSGCSLYENTDRENFNSKATPQTTASATGTETEPNSTSSSCAIRITRHESGSPIEIHCENEKKIEVPFGQLSGSHSD